MTMKKMIPGAIILLAVTMFSGSSLSQTRRTTGPRPRSQVMMERWLKLRAEQREKSRQMREQMMKEARKESRQQAREQSYREALQAEDAQWRIIMPKLMKVRDLQKEISVAVGIKNAHWATTTETLSGNKAGSNTPVTTTTRRYEDWSWTKSWEEETELTRAQKACDELIALFDSGDATDEQKAVKMNILRQTRQEVAKELAVAQRELRRVLNLRQEATLVMMGLLN